MDRERGYQRHPRYTKRLEVTFSSGVLSYRGILSNISANGLFIRTTRSFTPGTTITIELVLPDNQVSVLKGIVRRSIKTPVSTAKNGMGVELLEKDDAFINFVKSVTEVKDQETDPLPSQEFQIITCAECGVKNKIPIKKLSLSPKCGKCRSPLIIPMP